VQLEVRVVETVLLNLIFIWPSCWGGEVVCSAAWAAQLLVQIAQLDLGSVASRFVLDCLNPELNKHSSYFYLYSYQSSCR
jgi:hypothetical protein